MSKSNLDWTNIYRDCCAYVEGKKCTKKACKNTWRCSKHLDFTCIKCQRFSNDNIQLNCKHTFCLNCLSDLILNYTKIDKIVDFSSTSILKCPCKDCSYKLDDILSVRVMDHLVSKREYKKCITYHLSISNEDYIFIPQFKFNEKYSLMDISDYICQNNNTYQNEILQKILNNLVSSSTTITYEKMEYSDLYAIDEYELFRLRSPYRNEYIIFERLFSRDIFWRELCQFVLHPERIVRFSEKYNLYEGDGLFKCPTWNLEIS